MIARFSDCCVRALLFIRRTLSDGLIAIRRVVGHSTTYRCGEVDILLPPGHKLPVYRAEHLQYDRFLPILARHLGEKGVVVDVGANVGDTLAAMVGENRWLSYVCVEPDELFFSYLKRNLARLERSNGLLNVVLIKALVGDGEKVASLSGRDGTKAAVVGGKGGIRSRPLDTILSEGEYPLVKLIKSDVDGFDYEVIRSAMQILSCSAPILFFECQYFDREQRDSYESLIFDLMRLGYTRWVVFDNFGGVVLETSDVVVLRSLLGYVWAQNVGGSSRTIHYFDLLACAPKDDLAVSAALSDYQSEVQ